MTGGGVVVLSGPPCSGKTVVAAALAQEPYRPPHAWVHLEVDGLFDLLFPGSDRRRDHRMFAYDGAHHLARMVVDRGEMVVLECTYARRDQRAVAAGQPSPEVPADASMTPGPPQTMTSPQDQPGPQPGGTRPRR